MKIVPIDLGGSRKRCHVAPLNRAIPTQETVQLLVEEYQRKFPTGELHVGFFHGGVPDSEILEACSGMPIRVSLNPADLSKVHAQRLLDSGCTTIELEIMTGDPHVLRTCGRPYTSNQVLSMGEALKQMGFKVGLHLVPGLPSADVEGALRDAEETSQLEWVDFVRIWPALGFQGATISEWALTGAWIPWDVDQAIDVVYQMIEILDKRGKPTIRVGIQPGQDIPVRAVAGPVHPNIRGEIECRKFGKRLREGLKGTEPGQDVVVRVNPKDLGWAKGISNTNGRRGKSLFQLSSLRFQADPHVGRGTLKVIGNRHGSND